MDGKKCIITVINSISETSMPYNEFVLYRFNGSPSVKQVVIVCSETIPSGVRIPEGLRVICVGTKGHKIKKIMKQIEKECTEKGIEFFVHLHQPKSAILFLLKTIFKDYRKRTIFTVHSLFDAYNLINKVLSILTSLLSKKVICVSETSYKKYPVFVKKIKKNNIKVIKNGVDLNRIDNTIKSNVRKSNDVRILVYVARMIPIKNHKFLIKLFSRLDRCKLLLIGAEDKDGEIRKLIETEKLEDQVEIVGLIPRNEVFDRLKQADIYISPSLVEGLPVSVLEAMYVGLPVVLSNIKPHLEIGIHSTSVKTLPLIASEWVELLKSYLNLDEKSLKEIGFSCRHCAQNYFSLDSMLEQYDRIYETL